MKSAVTKNTLKIMRKCMEYLFFLSDVIMSHHLKVDSEITFRTSDMNIHIGSQQLN